MTDDSDQRDDSTEARLRLAVSDLQRKSPGSWYEAELRRLRDRLAKVDDWRGRAEELKAERDEARAREEQLREALYHESAPAGPCESCREKLCTRFCSCGCHAPIEPGCVACGKLDCLDHCPGCGGVADQGHDRCVPPSPYHCSKCDPPPEKHVCMCADWPSKEVCSCGCHAPAEPDPNCCAGWKTSGADYWACNCGWIGRSNQPHTPVPAELRKRLEEKHGPPDPEPCERCRGLGLRCAQLEEVLNGKQHSYLGQVCCVRTPEGEVPMLAPRLGCKCWACRLGNAARAALAGEGQDDE